MIRWNYITDEGVGLRTIYKSISAHRKTGAGANHSSFRQLLIDGRTKMCIQKNAKIINNGYFTLGITPGEFFPSTEPCQLTMLEGSKLVINGGNARIGRGVLIYLHKNACLEMGKNITINSNTSIMCAENIKIGNGTGISWGSEIIDTDFHRMSREGAVISAPIEIGNHVFVGRRVMIMKGVKIGDGSVIAAGAIVTRDVPPNCLAAGIPAKVIKENINWEY